MEILNYGTLFRIYTLLYLSWYYVMVFNTTKINICHISLLILFVMYMCYKGVSITKLVTEVYYDTKGFVIPKNMIWPRILNPSTRVRTMEFESRNDFWNIVPPNGKMVEIGVLIVISAP